ncbi:30S ribosomal protein S5 alanine N-acetyltransferase [Marinomonas agarivorans]|nr:30S ribosomal protein S5 alanine N-acetyltransferase [Marinomonas agarivorans]
MRLTDTPQVPYFALILTCRIDVMQVGFEIMLDKMDTIAAHQMGFIGSEKSFDEVNTHISYWRDRTSIEKWLNNPTYVRAQKMGENVWFSEYKIQIVEVQTETRFMAKKDNVFKPKFPIIKTERGVLRILEEHQADLLYDYVNNERAFLAPWEPERPESYYELDACRQRIKEIRKDFLADQSVAFFFLNVSQTKILGYSNFSNIVRGAFQACYLGYSLAEEEQGKGLMNEALKAGIDYMHTEQNIDRIMANYMPKNVASAAVLTRLGFEKEGVAKNYLKIAGQWEDHILTALVLR